LAIAASQSAQVDPHRSIRRLDRATARRENQMTRITPFLMFDGHAEAAMNFYASIFRNAEIASIARSDAGGPGAEGSIYHGVMTICGQRLMFFDSPVKHGFTFTPSISMFVDCDTEAELDEAYRGLEQGGQVMMPLGAYPFSRKFGWVADKFGVSWQLNLPG
jgi:predicted 3-demethylubiquinone-9 3-methyltransferase (glyoxalase superfamily)